MKKYIKQKMEKVAIFVCFMCFAILLFGISAHANDIPNKNIIKKEFFEKTELDLNTVATSSAVGDVIRSGKCGEDLTWVLTKYGTVYTTSTHDTYKLEIFGTGDMDDYTFDNLAPWYVYADYIVYLSIENGVTHIGNWAFYNCNLSNVLTIPSSVLSIGSNTFQSSDCSYVYVKNGVTNIGSQAFASSALKKVYLPQSLTYIGEAAFLCGRLNNIYYAGSQEEWNNITIENQYTKEYGSNFYYATKQYNYIYEVLEKEITLTDDFSGYINEEICVSAKIVSSGFVPNSNNISWTLVNDSGDEFNVEWGNVSVMTVTEGTYIVSAPATVDTAGTYTVTITTLDGSSASGELSVADKTMISIEDQSGIAKEEISIGAELITVTDFVPTNNNITWSLMDESGEEVNADWGKISVLTIDEGSYIMSCTVTVDLPGTYTLTVTTDDGIAASALLRVRPGEIKGFTAESHVGFVRLKWDTMDNVDGYSVSWKRDGDDTEQNVIVTDSGNGQKDIKDLERGKSYTFTICAVKTVKADSVLDTEFLFGEKKEINKTVLNLPFVTDCWGFQNPKLIFTISKSYFEKFVDKSQAKEFADNKGFNGRNGVCYGMSLSSGESWVDASPSLNALGVSSLYDYKSWSSARGLAQEAIKYAHASQVLCNESGFRISDISLIKMAILDYLYNGDEPAVLVIATNTNLDGSHAVLALDWIEEADGTVRIPVYDPNFPGESREIILSGENYSLWKYYGDYEGKTGEYTENGIENSTFRLKSFDSSVHQKVLLYVKYKIDLFNTCDMSDLKLDRIVTASDTSAMDEATEDQFYWVEKQDSYTINDIPGGSEIRFADGNHSIYVTASEDSSLTAKIGDDSNSVVKLSAVSGTEVEITFNTYSDDGDTMKTTTISGITGTSGTVSMESTDEGINICGLTDIAVNSCDFAENEDDEYSLESESIRQLETEGLDAEKEYILTRTEDGTEALLEVDTKMVVAVMEKHVHAWDSGQITKEATNTETGIIIYTCIECGLKRTEVIPKLTNSSDESVGSNTENTNHNGSDQSSNPGSSSAAIIKVQSIQLKGISNKIAAGKKIKLTAEVFPLNASNQGIIWTSSNSKVAIVNQNGVVTFKKKAGGKSVVITATAADGSGIKTTFKMKSMKGMVKKVTISGAKKKIVKAGKTLKLNAKVTATKGANKKLQWISSNTKYATVSASGKIKTKKAGKGKTVKITAMSTDGSNKKQIIKIKIR